MEIEISNQLKRGNQVERYQIKRKKSKRSKEKGHVERQKPHFVTEHGPKAQVHEGKDIVIRCLLHMGRSHVNSLSFEASLPEESECPHNPCRQIHDREALAPGAVCSVDR